MTTYTKFSLAAKIRLHENFTSETFYWRKYPDLRYRVCSSIYACSGEGSALLCIHFSSDSGRRELVAINSNFNIDYNKMSLD